jgi:hypothetical protein
MNCKPGDLAVVISGVTGLSARFATPECLCHLGSVVRVTATGKYSHSYPDIWLWELEERLKPCAHSAQGLRNYPDPYLRPLPEPEAEESGTVARPKEATLKEEI